MIVALTGNNSFLLKRRLKELTDEFVSKYGGLSLEKIDAEESDLTAILDVLQATSFLSNKRLVLLKNLSANKQVAEGIEQIISSDSNLADIIIYDSSPDKRTAYFKMLKSKTQLEEFSELDAAQNAKWLVAEAKKLGAKLSLADANYLINRAGTNQEQLFNELTKLAIYSADISRDTIDLLTVETPQSKVFDLLDAAFSGNKKQALELYDEQRAQKVEPQAIMAMLAWQLRLLALSKSGSRLAAVQIAKDAGVSPYPVTKAQRLASKLNDKQLQQMVKEALTIDELSKTRTMNLDEAIKTYITNL
jgi:DNA polymerase-3 subunit delta